MALSALVAQMTRSTNRSTPHHGDHQIQLRNVTVSKGLNRPWLIGEPANGAPERSATDGIGGRRIRGTVR
jgi:hypothetical protein